MNLEELVPRNTLVIITGKPKTGKSTLAMRMVCEENGTVLFIKHLYQLGSLEETLRNIKPKLCVVDIDGLRLDNVNSRKLRELSRSECSIIVTQVVPKADTIGSIAARGQADCVIETHYHGEYKYAIVNPDDSKKAMRINLNEDLK